MSAENVTVQDKRARISGIMLRVKVVGEDSLAVGEKNKILFPNLK